MPAKDAAGSAHGLEGWGATDGQRYGLMTLFIRSYMTDIPVLPFRIDLHVHTRRFSACAEGLPPEKLRRIISAGVIDGLVITEHDRLWPKADIDELNRSLDRGRIYRGIEVSSRNGHFVVIGLERSDGIAPGIDIGQLIEKVHSQDAAIIWAHPSLAYGSTPEPLDSLHLPFGVDAVEVASSVTTGALIHEAERLADTLGCARVAGSDAHTLSRVGCAYTRFRTLPRNEAEMALAIRQGQCTAGHEAVTTMPVGKA